MSDQEPERKAYKLTDDLSNVTVYDWIEGIGDVSTQYEVQFIKRFNEARNIHEEKHIKVEREKIIETLLSIAHSSRMVDLNGETGDESEEMVDVDKIYGLINSLRAGEP